MKVTMVGSLCTDSSTSAIFLLNYVTNGFIFTRTKQKIYFSIDLMDTGIHKNISFLFNIYKIEITSSLIRWMPNL